MPKKTALLSPFQQQALAEIGIDAWYGKPLSRAALDSDYQTSQENIAAIFKALDVSADVLADSDKTPKAAPAALSASPTLVNDNRVDKPKDKVSTPQKISIAENAFKPVRLDPNLDLSPPVDSLLHFPEIDAAKHVSPTLSAVQEAIDKLQDNDIGLDSSQTLGGKGADRPQWLLVFPPPTLKHIQQKQLFEKEEAQLFEELLQALGQTWGKVYVTPLLKQAVYKQTDPTPTLLAKHLPILQAEIACKRPKRIILMGRLAAHAVLSTKAPLSKLMNVDYQLQVNEQQYPLMVLPALHYFLALPAEKGLLWEGMKPLAATDIDT